MLDIGPNDDAACGRPKERLLVAGWDAEALGGAGEPV
jgi:hypothetical protein